MMVRNNPFVWIAGLILQYGWYAFLAIPVMLTLDVSAVVKGMLILLLFLLSIRCPFFFDVSSLFLMTSLLNHLHAQENVTIGWGVFFAYYAFFLVLNVRAHFDAFQQRMGKKAQGRSCDIED